VQTAGDIVSVVTGALETAAGGTAAGADGVSIVVTGGSSTPVAVPVIAGGAIAVAHGVKVYNTAYENLTGNKSNEGSRVGKPFTPKKKRRLLSLIKN
jgi:hypothetical protein